MLRKESYSFSAVILGIPRGLALTAAPLICAAILSSCQSVNESSIDTLTNSSPTTTTSAPTTVTLAAAPLGNSAISFSPASFDFGTVLVNVSTPTKTITVTNSSTYPLQLGVITSSNSNFEIQSSTCTSSLTLAPLGFCTMTLRFAPTASGVLSTLISVGYTSPGVAGDYSAGMSLTGSSTSLTNFAGLASITQVSATSAELNWTGVSGVSSYQAYDVTSGRILLSLMFPSVVCSGTSCSTLVSGLTPSTTYSYQLRATDTGGVQEGNLISKTVTTQNPGTLAAISDISVTEGSTVATASLSCADEYSNTNLLSIASQSDAALNCSLTATTGNTATVSCTPSYKATSGTHSAWSGIVAVQCTINGGVFSQTFTVNVANTNRAPSLVAIADQTVVALTPITPINANDSTHGTDTDVDGDALLYSCTFSGGGFTAQPCSSLPNTAYAFNTSTGVLSWTPSYAAAATTTTAYTLSIKGSDQRPSPLTSTRTFTLTVLPSNKLVLSAAASAPTTACTPITVTYKDMNNSAVSATSDMTITIGGKGSGGIYSDSVCSAPLTSPIITNGATLKTFYFKDATPESVVFTADTGTIIEGTLPFQVLPGATNTVAFTSLPATPATTDATMTFVAKEYDAFSNLVTNDSGPTATLTAYSSADCTTGALTSVLSSESTTISGGIATFSNVGLLKTSIHSIKATLHAVTACASSLTVTPGAFSLSQSTVAVSANTLISGATLTATLTPKDANGNLSPTGMSTPVLTYTAATGTGSIGASTVSGTTYIATVTGALKGTITIGATINVGTGGGALTSGNQTVTVSAGTFNVAQSTLDITASTLISGTTITATLTAKDAAGNTVPTGIAGTGDISFQSTLVGGTGTYGVITDATNGVYTSVFTAVKSGACTLNAKIQGATIGGSQAITINPGAFDLAHSTITTSAGTVISGTTITGILTPKDAADNLSPTGVTTTLLTYAAGSGTGSISATSGSGPYSATVTGILAGTITIGAKINNTIVTSGDQTVTVTPGAFNVAQSTLGVTASTMNSGSIITVTLTSKDTAGNANPTGITGGITDINFQSTLVGGTGTYGVVTNATNGVYTSVFTAVASGACTLNAKIQGTTIAGSQAITINAGAFDLAHSTIAVSSSTVVSSSTITATLTPKDAAGNINPTGVTTPLLTYTAGSGTGSITATAGSGPYTATVTGILAGNLTIGAKINTTTVTSGDQNITVTPGIFNPAQSALGVSASTVISAGTITVTLNAKDAAGNANPTGITGGTADISFQSTLVGGTGNYAVVTNATNGVFTSIFTAVKSGACTLNAKIQGTIIGGSQAITINPAAFDLTQSTITLSAGTVLSGSTVTATLTPKDTAGNTSPTGVTTPLLTYTAGSGTGSIGATTGTGPYTATVTGILVGTVTIGAKINNSLVTNGDQTVTVGPGTTVNSIAWGTAPATTYTASNSAAMTTFTAKILDAAGNLMTTNSTTTITLSITSGSGTLAGAYSAHAVTSGIATFSDITDTVASTIVITATENTASHTVPSSSITVNPAGINTLAFNTFSITGIPNTALTTQPIVTAYDQYANVATNSGASITLTAYSNACISAVTGGITATTNPVTLSSGVATFAAVTPHTNAQSVHYLGASDGAGHTICSSATLASMTIAFPAVTAWSLGSVTSGTVSCNATPTISGNDTYSAGTVVTATLYQGTSITPNCGGSSVGSAAISGNAISVTNFTAVPRGGNQYFYYTLSDANSNTSSCAYTGLYYDPETNLKVSFSLMGYSVQEYDGTTVGVQTGLTPVTVNRTYNGTAISGCTTNVTLTSRDVSAITGTDYTIAGNSISVAITGTSTSNTVPVASLGVLHNTATTGDQFFELKISAVTGVGAADTFNQVAQINTLDYELNPTATNGNFAFNQPLYTVNAGVTSATLTIQRLGSTTGQATVDVSIVGGSATTADYTNAISCGSCSGATVTFASGVAEVPITITVNPTGTHNNGANTSFLVKLTNPKNAANTLDFVRNLSATKVRIMNDAGPTALVDGKYCDSTQTHFGNQVASTANGALTNGNGTTVPYTICSITQLNWVAANAGTSNYNIMADLVNGTNGSLTSTGPEFTTAYNATFNGNEYIINGYSALNVNAANVGFISTLTGTTPVIKNLNFMNAVVTQTVSTTVNTNAGALIGGTTTSVVPQMSNLLVTGYVAAGYQSNGLLLGDYIVANGTATLSNLLTFGSITSKAQTATGTSLYTAGMFGLTTGAAATAYINATNLINGTNTLTYPGSTSNYMGGIIGYTFIQTNTSNGSNWTGVENRGYISGGSSVGGIVGGSSNANVVNNLNITAINYGNVAGTVNDVGGIVGYMLQYTGLSVSGSVNYGTITGAAYVGGILGTTARVPSSCNGTNYGAVTATGNYVGGIVGGMVNSSNANTDLSGSTNYGAVTGGAFVGGIGGQLSSNISATLTYSNLSNSGTITSNATASNSGTGGIFGAITQASATTPTLTISYATNSGTVTYGTTAPSAMGGILGLYYVVTSNVTASFTIDHSSNTGPVSGASYVGGVLGYANFATAGVGTQTLALTNNSNTGVITLSASYGGGILGYFYNAGSATYGAALTLNGNHSTVGAINCTGGHCGGLAGDLSFGGTTTNTIDSNYSTSNVWAGTGAQPAGGLISKITSGGGVTTLTVSNSYATGIVKATYPAGGLIASLSAGGGTTTIQKCYATGQVAAFGQTGTNGQYGGLIGEIYTGGANTTGGGVLIENSYATGEVGTSPAEYGMYGCVNSYACDGSYAGGLVGFITLSGSGTASLASNTVTIQDSYYATGSVYGTTWSGGLIGRVDKTTTGLAGAITLLRNYVAAGTSGSVSAFIGMASTGYTAPTTINYTTANNLNYWLAGSATYDTSGAGTTYSKAASYLKDSVNYQANFGSGWDFTNTWYAPTGSGAMPYPTLR